ncbi:MAG: hypothetical protein WCI77_07760 [Candidatus Omnitrophota bacterium]
MKKLIGLLILVVLIDGYTARIDAASNGSEASNYEYSDNDIPAVCFFPVEKARWSGYGVTNNDWGKLTDYQKTMFISEGIEEIKRIETGKVTVNIQEEGAALLIATNERVFRLQEEYPGLDVGMIKFLRDMLQDMGKIKE